MMDSTININHSTAPMFFGALFSMECLPVIIDKSLSLNGPDEHSEFCAPIPFPTAGFRFFLLIIRNS